MNDIVETMSLGWQDDGGFRLPGTPQGTLADWTAAANTLFAPGCEAQSFALLASFGAPLMELFATEEAATVVHLWGGRKKGKSTALTAAASVWGEPDVTAIPQPDLPYIARDLAHRDPLIVTARIKSYVETCSGILIAASSISIGSVPGVELQVAVPKALIRERDKNQLESDLRMNAGTAGLFYTIEISKAAVVAELEHRLAEKVAMMRDETKIGDTARFPMRAIAASWVAGEVAARLGLLECDPQRVARWAMKETFSPPE